MSKIKNIKEKYPQLNISFIDILSKIDKTGKNKYLPLMAGLLDEHIKQINENNHDLHYVKDSLISFYSDSYSELSDTEAFIIYRMLDNIPKCRSMFESINKFIDYNEKGLIDQSDVLSYKTMKEVEHAISIASLKSIDKELSKFIYTVYEDEKWIILRPLSHASSRKYGACTKWCTTASDDPYHFWRYFSRGTLIYIINKISGSKVAIHQYLDEKESAVLWDATSTQIDWFSTDIDDYIYPIVRNEVKLKKKNIEFCTPEDIDKISKECKVAIIPSIINTELDPIRVTQRLAITGISGSEALHFTTDEWSRLGINTSVSVNNQDPIAEQN